VPTPVSRTLHFAAVFWSPHENTVPVVPSAAFSHCSALGSDFPAHYRECACIPPRHLDQRVVYSGRAHRPPSQWRGGAWPVAVQNRA